MRRLGFVLVALFFGPLLYQFAIHDWRLGTLIVVGITAKVLNGAIG